MKEIWKDIDGYEGLYQVSNLGNVKSCKRLVKAGPNLGQLQTIHEKILKPGVGKYKQVSLCKDGKVSRRSIHRLVAQAFIPNPNNYPCTNHKDENPSNNCADNLEWCTYKYNNEYNDRVNKCKDKISSTLTGRKYNRVLTDEQRKHISDGAKRGWLKRKSAITTKEEV